eukprot:CAMPEP_0116939934 /NCGR_PEP_ID=MMETSP0467-20121206/33055_1 /TAXON_ID=283647 /ORGANISM="Mesodinium pulex, Strain SPMC105" /LENGTH=163 /DNA_ID=CAMNT_0004622355 /DNA_START=43 /DNA_END=534 /DNA_ORIENTATION=-
MLIFKDLITDDELSSDASPFKLVDDIVYDVEAKFVIRGSGVDIPTNDEDGGGLDDGEERVINIVDAHNLTETSFTKKQYMVYIKGYMKKLIEHLQENDPERVAIFQKNVQPFVKKVLSNFNDYQFFMGESMDPNGMIALCYYGEDGMTPRFLLFKDGLKEEKY